MKKQLMLVAMLSVGTALTTMGRVKPVAASLTPPSVYDYSYTWNPTDSEQYLNVNGVDSIPLYTRTADGIYFNYTSTFNVIDGLSVTQTFNRSNTAWQASGIFYKPDENKIGSNNAVGTITNKYDFIFQNNTNNNYRLYVDLSSSTSFAYSLILNYTFNSTTVNHFGSLGSSSFFNFIVPSFAIFRLQANSTSAAAYFDAWYLQDLGISDAYQQGLDAETQGILTDYLGTDAQQIGWVLIGIAAILFAFKGGK
jgi:hypothetical protein